MLHKGFTLLELMITVVILSILATIAYPSYMNQVKKTRRVDGKAAVLEIAMAEEQYYTQNKAYTSDLSLLSIGSALKATPSKSKEGYYTINLQAATTTFTVTATAIGSQAKDTECKEMAMNQMGEQTSKSSTDQCW